MEELSIAKLASDLELEMTRQELKELQDERIKMHKHLDANLLHFYTSVVMNKNFRWLGKTNLQPLLACGKRYW